MESRMSLEEAGMIFGRCAVTVHDGCKNRRSALSLADKLLNVSMLVGGHVEGILKNGGDGESVNLAVNEINRARYIAKVIGENGMCKSRLVNSFLTASDNLLDVILHPVPAQASEQSPKEKRKADRAKKVKAKKAPKGADPDGFDDPVE